MNHIENSPGFEKAKIINREDHNISRKLISPNALKVLYRLGEGNFDGYLVGGCVRDIMLGKKPKDFDVATSATPEQVHSLFKNARIIGRRFKIVHIRYGREIIEVTTFRANHDASNEIADGASRRKIKELDSAHSTSGMILRDNVYGNIDDDALRRDFTINALYYSLDQFRVLDFCGGIEDLNSHSIRMIGDPEARYREDPVRMLRAIRFAAKLDFDLETSTAEPIDKLAYLLESISSARLFDETIKLLTGGNAVKTFELLRQSRVGDYLFAPTMNAISSGPDNSSRLLDLALINTDSRLALGKSVTPAFLFAALLWPVLQNRIASISPTSANDYQRHQNTANDVILEQLPYTAVPKRFTIAAKEIWELQLRLARRNKRSIESAFAHPRFRAAYDFLLLREESGEELGGLGQWWTDFQLADQEQRRELAMSVAKTAHRLSRKPSRKPSRGKGEAG
ncbi:MAG: poly(A) polymerase [Pseudohongiellaceae bacterium]|jgi:poly(A) polymerase